MRELETLPEPQRASLSQRIKIGTILIHKRTMREWEVKQIWRKDNQVQVKGPGVNSPMTLTYDEIRRGWTIKNGDFH